MLYILHIINRPFPRLTAVLHPQGYTAISFAVLVLATQGTAIAPLLFIALSPYNFQRFSQLAHALSPQISTSHEVRNRIFFHGGTVFLDR
jgi:hypothetical protein